MLLHVHVTLSILCSSLILMTGIAAAVGSNANARTPVIPLCPADRQSEADRCASVLFLIGENSKSKFPVTIEETDAYCRDLLTVKSCVNSFTSKCLRGLSKTASTLMIRGASKEVERICSGTENRTELIQHTACLNHQKIKLDKCMSQYIVTVDGLEKAAVKDKIPGSCCTFYTFSQCVDQQLLTADRAVCTESSRQYISQMMSTFASDVLNLLCRQTPKGSPACKHLQLVSRGRTSKALSVLVPFVKAFDSFHPA